jgi:Cytochrome P460
MGSRSLTSGDTKTGRLSPSVRPKNCSRRWWPTLIAAYKAGVPGNGKPFPDGSKIAKIEWKLKKSTEAPFSVNVPDTLQDVFLIEKDTQRFPDTKGWAYAVFDYNPASDTYTPDATGTVNCGFACHTIVASKDYIFHSYQKR